MNSTRFLELLAKLRETEASFARIKVLSELWRHVSGLSANERKELLRELGAEGQQRVIEGFLSSPGTRSDEILKLADELLSRPEPQKGKVAEGQILAAQQPGTQENELDSQASTSGQRIPPVPPAYRPPEIPSTTRTLLAEEVCTDTPQASSQTGLPDPTLQPAEDSGTNSPESIPFIYEKEDLELEAAGDQEDSFFEGMILELSATEPTSARFRILINGLGRLTTLNCSEVNQLLELVPPGWMRRRVLMAILRSGMVTLRGELIELIRDSITHPPDYLWYSGELLRSFPLSDHELGLLLEFAPTASVRRTLLHRWQTHRFEKPQSCIDPSESNQS